MLLRVNFTQFEVSILHDQHLLVEVRSSPIVDEHSIFFSKTNLDLLSIASSSFFILELLGVSIGQEPCGKQQHRLLVPIDGNASSGPGQMADLALQFSHMVAVSTLLFHELEFLLFLAHAVHARGSDGHQNVLWSINYSHVVREQVKSKRQGVFQSRNKQTPNTTTTQTNTREEDSQKTK